MHSVELVGRMLISLAVVIGVIWFIAKKFRGKAGHKRRTTKLIDVMGRANLTRASSVAVVRVADQALIVGVTDSSVRTLGTIEVDAVNAALVDSDPKTARRQPADHTATGHPPAGRGRTTVRRNAAAPRNTAATDERVSVAPSSPAALSGTLTAADIEAIRATRLTDDPLPDIREYDDGPLPDDVPAGARTTEAVDSPSRHRDTGPLSGSALSPATWRQTLDALRDMTVRKG